MRTARRRCAELVEVSDLDAGGYQSTQFVGACLSRILKLAHTIADLAGSEDIQSPHLAEACVSAVVTKYQKRISGPILDRIDFHIEVPRVDYEKLSSERMGETSESIRKRVQVARDIQNKRCSDVPDIICNADMRIGEVRQFCQLQPEGVVLSSSKYQSLMRAAMSQLNLSARAYHRMLKLARTIADLAGGDEIQFPHLAEALRASQSSEDHDRVKY